MALLKYMKKEVRPSFKPSVLPPKDNKAAQISVAKAVSTAAERSRMRGQYNACSNEQRSKIEKYAAENGTTNAAKYTATWGIEINESTARRFKNKYLQKLKEEISERSKQ